MISNLVSCQHIWPPDKEGQISGSIAGDSLIISNMVGVPGGVIDRGAGGHPPLLHHPEHG